MGLVAAFFYLIPMFGPIITAILVTLLLIPSSLWAGLIFLISYIIYAQIENNLISPKIQGKGLNLPPLLILVAVTIGIYAFGLIGCVIAIPVAGCIRVIIEELPNLKELSEELLTLLLVFIILLPLRVINHMSALLTGLSLSTTNFTLEPEKRKPSLSKLN